MDDRHSKLLRWVVRKLSFISLPNLGMFIAAITVMGFIGRVILNLPIDRFIFSPEMVWQGEWWRLFAYPVNESLTNPLWLFFYVLYIYFIMNSLEVHWGPGPLTVYTLFSYLAAIAGSMLLNRTSFIWFHVIENLSLAFGTLFPDIEFLLFFIIPVKAKWLALLAGGWLVVQAILGGWDTALFLFIVMMPYLIFFGPYLVSTIQGTYKRKKNRNRMDPDMWR